MMARKFIRNIAIAFILVLLAYYFYPEPTLPKGVVITRIEVDKSDHEMNVFSGGDLVIKSYKISIGRGSWGIHAKDWDNNTPIGDYIIDSKFTNSSFHKALTISFGNLIEIHGMRNHLGFIGKFHRWIDWTAGCIAVTNAEVDELYSAVPIGTPISIRE